MKFNDGFWRQTPGLRTIHPSSVRDVVVDGDVATIYAPTRPISNRRHTLNNPVVEIRVWSPADNVLGVRLNHFTGRREGSAAFAFDASPRPGLSVECTETEVIVSRGDLSLHVALTGYFELAFRRAGELLTVGDRRCVGITQADSGRNHIFQRLSLIEGDLLYGLGERSTPLIKNGQTVETWNDDGGPSSWHSYKAVPFLLSHRGWGLLVNSPGPVSFEVGTEFSSQLQFSLPGQELEYFVFADDTPKGVLSRYTGLTGRPALPPPWSFGLWLSTSFVTDYDESTVNGFVEGMAERSLPLSVVHFDCFWMREFQWCDFAWDRNAFPDPEGMLARLHARGLKTCLWINPYIAQRSPLFEEAKRAGYLLLNLDGDVWQWDTWQAGMAFVDFTNPAACDWFAGKLRALLDMGVDSFKTDFGEKLPLDARYHNGADPELMHNLYSYLYNKVVHDVLTETRGTGEAVVFARSGTVGSQKLPVHWGGDPEPTYSSMAETLRSGLSLTLSGFGFWSHDIGGFEGEPTPDLFMRWVAFGLLSSHSRLHGSISHRVPWRFGDEAVDVVRLFTRLKLQLMPYLWAASLEAHQQGTPVMRAMMLEFPEDPTCRYLDRQYMLGPDLLVAPVMRADGQVEYYVPAGRWTDYRTGRTVAGPGWRRETHDFTSLPLLVRPGAVIPVGSVDHRPDYDYSDGVTLEVFSGDLTEFCREISVSAPQGGDAVRFSVRVGAGEISISSDSPLSWSALLVGVAQAEPLAGTSASAEPRGLRLAPTRGTATARLLSGAQG